MLLLATGSYTHISTSLLSVLPSGSNKEIIQKFETLHNSKVLMLAVKGFDDAALERITKIESALEKSRFVEPKRFVSNTALEEHYNRYRYYIDEINGSKVSKLDMHQTLSGIYEEMTHAFFPVAVDRYDPLGIYAKTPHTPVKLHHNHLILEGYGYLSLFDIGSQNLDEHTEVYRTIKSLLLAYPREEIRFFSPIFYYVENSEAIKTDVNRIILIATILLLLLYLLMLRNIWLLLNTITTLATSSILAIFVVTELYPEVSIFVIVFGVSISTVSIDYLFHHYFHHYYDERKRFNKEVLYGFLTTAGAFAILALTDFTLVRQISLFSIISLGVSYLHFAFLYPQIGFKQSKASAISLPLSKRQISYRTVFVFSLLIILASPSWIRLDSNIRNLDYRNSSLQQTEQFFKTHLPQDERVAIWIEADSIDVLIHRAKKVKSFVKSASIPLSGLVDRETFDVKKRESGKLVQLKLSLSEEAKKIGFREGYFDDAYLTNLEQPLYTIETLKHYDIPLLKSGSKFIAYGTIDKKSLPCLSSFKFAKPLSVKTLFEKTMRQSADRLIALGLLAILFIVVMLLVIAGRGVIRALTYLLFPLAVILLYAHFVPLNILHIFMLFIVLSISIDYGIYTAKRVDVETKRAIAFSLLSTFAGFGVLVFSQINALFSIGIIATLGILALFLLLIFLKGPSDVSHAA